jgi:hypothetical protein
VHSLFETTIVKKIFKSKTITENTHISVTVLEDNIANDKKIGTCFSREWLIRVHFICNTFLLHPLTYLAEMSNLYHFELQYDAHSPFPFLLSLLPSFVTVDKRVYVQTGYWCKKVYRSLISCRCYRGLFCSILKCSLHI